MLQFLSNRLRWFTNLIIIIISRYITTDIANFCKKKESNSYRYTSLLRTYYLLLLLLILLLLPYYVFLRKKNYNHIIYTFVQYNIIM